MSSGGAIVIPDSERFWCWELRLVGWHVDGHGLAPELAATANPDVPVEEKNGKVKRKKKNAEYVKRKPAKVWGEEEGGEQWCGWSACAQVRKGVGKCENS